MARLQIPDKASIPALCDIMMRAVNDKGIGGALGKPYLSHISLMDCGGPEEPVQFGLTDVQPSLALDDCESSAELATEARLTLMDVPRDAGTLGQSLKQWSVFRHYTPHCNETMSKICNRGADVLLSKKLKISTTVGMASDARPTADAGGKAPVVQEQYGGHCFNIGRVFLSNGNVRCFLLEGTAPMDEVYIESMANAVKIQVKIMKGKDCTIKPMLLHEYLCILGRTVSKLTQIINSPNGGRAGEGGIPRSHAPEMHGWLASTLFSPSLNSDKSVPFAFYHRVIYSGMAKDSDVKGCLPVEPDTSVGADRAFVAGCHPYSLSDMDLRGLDVPVANDKFQLMSAIMNEAHPPMVDHAIFKRVSDLWAECSPLSTLNTYQPLRQLKGCEYVRVACMETPMIPEFGDIICRIKGQVCDLANEINLKRLDSDHAFFVYPKTPQGVMKREGTGCHIFIDVPIKACTSTIVHSLRSALKRLQYPGYEPIGDEI